MKKSLLSSVSLSVAVLATSVTPQRPSSNILANPLLSAANVPAQQPFLSSILDTDSSLSSCKPTGQIRDAVCDYETVENDINSSNFFQTLSSLVQEKYFRFYKVDLYKDCPFWNENSFCMSRDCTVSKVDEVRKYC
jgi:hypothetical protein